MMILARKLFPFLMLALNGLLLGFSAPGINVWWLAWVALMPALIWVSGQSRFSRRVLWGGACFGFSYTGLYCSWLTDLQPLDWLGFSLINGFLVALMTWFLVALAGAVVFSVMFLLYSALLGFWARLLLYPLLWVLISSLFYRCELTIPWALIEYTQAPLFLMRQLSGLFGFSGSVAVVLVVYNVLGATVLEALILKKLALCKGGQTNRKAVSITILVVILCFPALLGVVSAACQTIKRPDALPFPVLVMQGDIPIQSVRAQHFSGDLAKKVYIDPVSKKVLPKNTLLVFPEEGVVSGIVQQSHPLSNASIQQLQQLAVQKKSNIIVGATLYEDVTQQYYNGMVLLSGKTGEIQFYQKRHLVPFGEYTPYGLAVLFKPVLAFLHIDYDPGFAVGHLVKPLSLGQVTLGCLVCFELIDSNPFFEGYAQQYKDQSVTLLVNASNLGWFHGNTLLASQFLAIAQFRSAEVHLPLVMSSNTGVSVILSSDGSILRQTKVRHSAQYKTVGLFYNGIE